MTQLNPEYPYTQRQWDALDEEMKTVIQAVAEYLSGERLAEYPTAETLSETLNLLRPCKGCVPEEEIDENLLKAIRRKMSAVYRQGIELTIKELQRRGHQPGLEFNLSLVIDPDDENFSYVTIVDAEQGGCFLHEGHKAWHFHFATLTELAEAVLSVRDCLVTKVLNRLAKEQEIFVVMEGGVVHEIADIPSGVRVTIIDHDIEGLEPERLETSPLNQRPCCLQHF